MKNKNTKKLLIPITSSLVVSASIAATIGATFKLNNEKETKSYLNFLIRPTNVDNEWESNKPRKEVTINNNKLLLPFNHEVINELANLATNKQTLSGDWKQTVNSSTYSSENKAAAVKAAMKKLFNINVYNRNYGNFDKTTNSITFGSLKVGVDQFNIEFVSENNTEATFKFKTTTGSNDQEIEFTLPRFESKVVDASSMNEIEKAIVTSFVVNLNKELPIDVPRTDIYNKIVPTNQPANSKLANDEFQLGRLFFKNKIKNLLTTNQNTNDKFNLTNLKYWYSLEQNALFVYDAVSKKVFVLANWGLFLTPSDLLTDREIFENDTAGSDVSPFANPKDRLADIKKALETKYNNKSINVNGIKLEGVSGFTLNTTNVDSNVKYVQHSSSNSNNTPTDITFRSWTVNYSNSSKAPVKIYEINPYLHQTVGYVHEGGVEDYYNGIIEVYQLLNESKRVKLSEIKKKNPNNYILKRFFLEGTNIDVNQQNGNNADNDARSIDVANASNFNDIELELVQYDKKAALLVHNAISENALGNKGQQDDRRAFAGRPLKMIIDDLPQLVNDSRYKATTLTDIVKYSFVADRDIKNFKNFGQGSPIYNDIKGLNNDEKNRVNIDRVRKNIGWASYQKMKAEHGIKTGKKEHGGGHIDFLGNDIPFNRLQVWTLTSLPQDNRTMFTDLKDKLYREHMAIVEYAPFRNKDPNEITAETVKIHGIIQFDSETFIPYFPIQQPHNDGVYESNLKELGDINGEEFQWPPKKNNGDVVLKDDGLFTTFNIIDIIGRAKEVNYDNPLPNVPLSTDPSFSGEGYKIPKTPGEPPKKPLYDPDSKLDLRDGYTNVVWPPDLEKWAENPSITGARFGLYFVDLFKKRNPRFPNLRDLYVQKQHRYTDNWKTGVLTGLETIQYFPEFGKIVISDNGYYRDYENNKWVTKRRLKNGKLDPFNIIIYGFINVELAHNLISAIDLAQAGWNKEKAYKNKIANLPNSPIANGAKALSQNFHVINPQLSENKYNSQQNISSESNYHYSNANKGNQDKYIINNNDRFLIDFETKEGEKKQIYVLDYDIMESTKENGASIFLDVDDFNKFFKGVLKEGEYVNLPENSISAQAIRKMLEKKEGDGSLKSKTGNIKHKLSDIRVARVGDSIAINAKTSRFLPTQFPGRIPKDKIAQLFNLHHQEYNLLINDLPLYYKDVDINLSIPNVKDLIETGRTFEEEVKHQLDTKFRQQAHNNKIIFGAVNNPDIEVSDKNDLQIQDIDYDKKTFKIVDIRNNKSILVKVTKDAIPQVKYISAFTTNNNKPSLKNYGENIKFISEDLVHKFTKLHSNGNSGSSTSTLAEPNTYISVNASTSGSTQSNNQNSYAKTLYQSEEITTNFPSNMKRDSANVELRYDASKKRLIFVDNDGNTTNSNGNPKRPAALVITHIPLVVWAGDLVNKPDGANSSQPGSQSTNGQNSNKNEDTFVNEVLKNDGEVIKTINTLLNSSNDHNGVKWIGGAKVTNPHAAEYKLNSLLQIASDDLVNPDDPSDKRTKTIGIYDKYSYFIDSVDGSNVFSNYDKLYETIEGSKLDKNQNPKQPRTADSFTYKLEQNQELVDINNSNDVNNSVRDRLEASRITSNSDDGKVKVGYIIHEDKKGSETIKKGRFIIKGYIQEGNEENKPAIYVIDNVPNVVKSKDGYLPSVSKEEIIAKDGNEFQALIEKWKTNGSSTGGAQSQTSNQKVWENNKFTIGLSTFNPDNVIFSFDKSRKYLTIIDKTTFDKLAVVIFDTPIPKVVKNEGLYSWQDVVDNGMDIEKTINSKILDLYGAPIDDNYDLTGYKFDPTSNNSPTNANKNYYVIKKDTDEVILIDNNSYVTNDKGSTTKQDKLFNGREIFKDYDQFKTFYDKLTTEEKPLSENANEQLKTWLNSQSDNSFKNNNNSNIKVKKYKDSIILFVEEQTSTSVQNPKRQHILGINNLPRIVKDYEIKLKVPTLDELISEQKTLEEVLKDRLSKLADNTDSSKYKVDGWEFDKSKTKITFDYTTDLITLTQDNKQSIKISSSSSLPSIKIVKASETNKNNNKNKTIDFSNLENAYIINSLYKEINQLSDYTTSDPGAKLFSALPFYVTKSDHHDLKEQFGLLTDELKDTSHINQKLFNKDSKTLTIKYVPEKDLIVIKDSDSTPSALLITENKRYTDKVNFAIPSSIATQSNNALDVKKIVTDYINGLSTTSEGAKLIGNYVVFNPEFSYAESNEQFVTIKYSKTKDEAQKDQKIYIVDRNKYHNQVSGIDLKDSIIKQITDFNKIQSKGFKELTALSLLSTSEQTLLKELFKKASSEDVSAYQNIRYRFIIHNNKSEVIFAATKDDSTHFPISRTFYFKLTDLVNVTNDSVVELQTPGVWDVINAGFVWTEAFKRTWFKDVTNNYTIGTTKVLDANLDVTISDDHSYAIVKDKSKQENDQIIGYVVFKNKIEKIEKADYSQVPAQELKQLMDIISDIQENNNREEAKAKIKTLNHVIKDKVASFDQASINVELIANGDILINDRKQPVSNYLLLTEVPKLFDANSFYNLFDLANSATDKVNPVELITNRWANNKRIEGKQVTNPFHNTTKSTSHYYAFTDNDLNTNANNKLIYVYDKNIYKEEVVKANVSDVNLYRASAIKTGSDVVTLDQFDNVEVKQLVESNFLKWTNIKLRLFRTRMVVQGQENGETKYGFITNLPDVLDASGLEFPDENIIINNFDGEVNNAFKAIIADDKKTPRKDGKISIFTNQYDPANVKLEFNNITGQIKLYNNNNFVQQFAPSIPMGKYSVIDANQRRYNIEPKEAYKLIQAIKKASIVIDNQHKYSEIGEFAYLSTNLPIDINLADATIEYIQEKNMIVVRGSNKFGNRLIIQNVPRVVLASDVNLYTIDEVVKNNQDLKKTVEDKINKINSEVLSTKAIGSFEIDGILNIEAKTNNPELIKINSNSSTKYKKEPIYLIDEVDYVKPINTKTSNTFITKNDLKSVLVNTNSNYTLISSNANLNNNSVQNLLANNSIIKDAEIKKVQLENKTVLVIKGKNALNKTKVLLLKNLPTIIFTKFDDPSYTINQLTAYDLLAVSKESQNTKTALENAYKKVLKDLATKNGNKLTFNNIEYNIDDSLRVILNSNNDPYEFRIVISKDNSIEEIGTIILPKSAIPVHFIVNQPTAWTNNPNLAHKFYVQLTENNPNLATLLEDANLKTILPVEFDRTVEGLDIVNDVNNYGFYIINNKQLVLVKNAYVTIDHKNIYSLADVAKNNNDQLSTLEAKLEEITKKPEQQRVIKNIKVPNNLDFERVLHNYNVISAPNFMRIFVIDNHKYKQQIEGISLFVNNVALNKMLAELRSNNNQTISSLANKDMQKYFSKLNLKQEEAIVTLLTKDDKEILMVRSSSADNADVYIIVNLPKTKNAKELGLNLPTIDDLIKSNGNVNKAIIDKIKDSNNQVAIDGKKYNANEITVVLNPDGSITLIAPDNKEVTIVADNPLPVVKSMNANSNDYAQIFKLASAIVGNEPSNKEKAIVETKYESIKDVVYFKKVLTTLYGSSLPDFSNAKVTYNRNSNQIVIYSEATEEKFSNLLIINNVPQIIDAKDIFKLPEAIKNITTIDQYLSAQIKNKALSSANKINQFEVADDFELKLLDNRSDFVIAPLNKTTHKDIYVISPYEFNKEPYVGSTIFKQLHEFNRIKTELEKNTLTAPDSNLDKAIGYKTLNNRELNGFVTNDKLLSEQTKLLASEDKQYWILVDKNRISIINKLPAIIFQSSLGADKKLPEATEIINNDGDISKAIVQSLTKDNKELKINDVRFNPQTVSVIVNKDQTITFIDPETNQQVSVVLDKPFPEFVTINARTNPSFNNILEVHKLRKLIEKGTNTDRPIKDLLELLGEDNENEETPIADSNILPDSFKDKGTFKFDENKNQLTFFNNDDQKPTYIVINNLQKTVDSSVLYNNKDVVANGLSAIATIRKKIEEKIKPSAGSSTAIVANSTTNDKITIGKFTIGKDVSIQTLNNYNYALVDNKSNDVVYIIDNRFYDLQSINANNVFKTNDIVYRFNKLVLNNNENKEKSVRMGILADQDGIIKTDEMVDVLENVKNFDYAKVLVTYYDDQTYILEGYDKVSNNKRVLILTNIKKVVNVSDKKATHKPLPFDTATPQEIADAKSVAAAYTKKILEVGKSKGGKVTIDSKEYDANDLLVVENPDKSVSIFQKDPSGNNKHIISFVDDNNPNTYTIKDSQEDNTVFKPDNNDLNKLNNLLNSIKSSPNDKGEGYKQLKTITEKNPEFKAYLQKLSFSAIDDDKAKIKYNSQTNQILVSDGKEPANIIILNDVLRVVDHTNVYQPEDVLVYNNNKKKAINEALKKKEKDAKGFVRIAEYKGKPPFTLRTNKAKQIMLIGSARSALELTLIDNNIYSDLVINGSEIFKDVRGLESLISKVKSAYEKNSNKTLKYDSSLNKELEAKLNKENIARDEAVLKWISPSQMMLYLPLKGIEKKGYNGQANVYLIDNIPQVLKITESPIHFPSIDEVINADGNLVKATLSQIKNLPISSGGLITIGNKKLNPNYVDVQIAADGSIQIFTFDPLKPNDKHLAVALSQVDQNFKYPKYEARDGSYVDHRSLNTVYEMFKKQAVEENNKWTLPLSTIKDNQVIKQLLANEFKKPETGLVDVDLTEAKLTYIPNLSKLVLKATLKTNQDQEYVLIINDVKNVIVANELYSNNQVLDNNPSNAIINALEAKVAKNDFSVGVFRYIVENATYKELDLDQKVKSDSNIVDIHNKLIYVIDDFIYKSISEQTWNQAIKNIDQLNKLIAKLNYAPNQFVGLFKLNNPELNALVKAQGFDLETTKVATIDGKLQFVGKDINNNLVQLTIPYVDNVVSSDYVSLFNDGSLIENNGDLNATIKQSLTNKKLYPRNANGEIKIGNNFVRPEEVLIDVVDGAVKLSIRDPSNLNKTKQLSKILLNHKDEKIANTNYFGYSINNLNKQGWADVIRDLNQHEAIKQNKPVLLKPFLSSLAINQVLKKDINLSKATIEYNTDKTKIVIRDNQETNGNVFVIYDLPTASKLQNNQDMKKLHTWWDDNIRIWAPILSAIGAILIAMVGIVIAVVKKHKKQKKKQA